jgi:hypothetical protein
MGQVIDFNRRQTRSAENAQGASAASPQAFLAQPVYPQAMLVHHMALWRSLVASYASLWFAPFGIEVKVIESGERPIPKVRARSGGG